MAHIITKTAAAALVSLALVPAGALAETRCGVPSEVLRTLHDQYGEVPTFSGAIAAGNPITITVSPQGTWTAMVVVAERMCVIAGGDSWQTVAPQMIKPEQGSLPGAPALLRNGLILIAERP